MNIELAKREETEAILSFIKELAEYEQMLDEVVAKPSPKWGKGGSDTTQFSE